MRLETHIEGSLAYFILIVGENEGEKDWFGLVWCVARREITSVGGGRWSRVTLGCRVTTFIVNLEVRERTCETER